MGPCNEVTREISHLVTLSAGVLPPGIREHLAGCPACARALAAARLGRALLEAAGEAPEPPAAFRDRVLTALPVPGPQPAEADMWRLGWGLVPAFAVTAALVLVLYQASPVSNPAGLVPTEGLSAGEQLVLEATPPDPDVVLAAVMEGGGA